jgi:hypothetical protein
VQVNASKLAGTGVRFMRGEAMPAGYAVPELRVEGFMQENEVGSFPATLTSLRRPATSFPRRR